MARVFGYLSGTLVSGCLAVLGLKYIRVFGYLSGSLVSGCLAVNLLPSMVISDENPCDDKDY